MKPDDQVCYCYHVSLRKLTNFALREMPQRASQMSNCLGAGTGCGWCIPMLKKILESARQSGASIPSELPENPEQYAQARQDYLKSDNKNVF